MATVVLCQGILGKLFERLADGIGPLRLPAARYFGGIVEALQADGYRVLTPQTHPSAGIATRAGEILQYLREHAEPGERCLLVGHSMGGLDCRHLLSALAGDDLDGRIGDTLLTIATPHRGSPVADVCHAQLQDRLRLYDRSLKFGLDLAAGRELRCDAMRSFNERTPAVPGIRYLSVTTGTPVSKMMPPLRPGGRIIERVDGENDGLVSRRSAVWGEVIDHWPVDHINTLDKGWFKARTTAAGRWVAVVHQATSERASAMGATT